MQARRAIGGGAAAALAVAAVALAPGGALAAGPNAAARAPHARAATPPTCGSGQLAVWIDPRGSGAAGSVDYQLRFTNISARPCMLNGFPGVAAVNASGRQLGAAASRSPVQRATRVVLAGARLATGGPVALGATATASLRIADVQDYPSPRCGRATAVGLRVYPPNERAARFVAFPFVACSRTGAPYLAVEAVQR